MKSIINKILLWVCVALGISIFANVLQYKIYHRKPVIDTVIETDTIIQLDTVFQAIYKDTFIVNPQPVIIDTVLDIRVYRDTVYHDYGWVSLTSTTHGSLLSQGIGMQFSVPNYYQTRTITNTITHTVRNDLVFVHGGFDYSLLNYSLSPVVGATYIWNKHRRIMSVNYSFMDKRIELNAGFSLWR